MLSFIQETFFAVVSMVQFIILQYYLILVDHVTFIFDIIPFSGDSGLNWPTGWAYMYLRFCHMLILSSLIWLDVAEATMARKSLQGAGLHENKIFVSLAPWAVQSHIIRCQQVPKYNVPTRFGREGTFYWISSVAVISLPSVVFRWFGQNEERFPDYQLTLTIDL
jgi:hypothetical protein